MGTKEISPDDLIHLLPYNCMKELCELLEDNDVWEKLGEFEGVFFWKTACKSISPEASFLCGLSRAIYLTIETPSLSVWLRRVALRLQNEALWVRFPGLTKVFDHLIVAKLAE